MATVNTPALCRTRFARLSLVAIEVFSKMLQSVAEKNVQPDVAFIMVTTNPALYRLLNFEEKDILKTLKSDGYSKCDAVLLYKILRHILPQPAKGWGRKPGMNDKSVSDDTERLRLLRNKIFHRPCADVEESEEWDVLSDIFEIAERLDRYLCKDYNDSFLKEVTHLSSSPVDEQLEEKYVKAGLEIEDLKRKSSFKEGNMTVHLSSGKQLDVTIAEVLNQVPKPGEIELIAEIKGMSQQDNDSIIKFLNENEQKFNDRSRVVIIKKAEEGSVIIHLHLVSIQTKEQIFKDINAFSHLLLSNVMAAEMLTADPGTSIDLMFFPNVISQESTCNDSYSWPLPSDCSNYVATTSSIAMKINLNASTIHNECDLFRETSELLKGVFRKSNVIYQKENCKDIDVIFNNAVGSCNSADYKSKQMPMPSVITMRHLVNVKHAGDLTDCIVVNQEFVFSDSASRRIIIHSFNGSFIRQISCKGRPWCMAHVGTDVIAITFPFEHNIGIISLGKGNAINTIQFGGSPWGIAHNENQLFVSSGVKSLHVLTIDGIKVRTFPLPTSFVRYITIYRDRMFCTDDITFYCCDFYGNLHWAFKNDKKQVPRGITTDEEGVIFVTSYQSGNVIEVSPDGAFRGDTYGLEWPTGVFYDNVNNCLLVCNQFNGKAFCFDVRKEAT